MDCLPVRVHVLLGTASQVGTTPPDRPDAAPAPTSHAFPAGTVLRALRNGTSQRGRACTLSSRHPRGTRLPVVSLAGVSFISAAMALVMKSSESDVAYTDSYEVKDPRGDKKTKKGYFPLFPEIEGFLEIPEIGGILSELGEEAEEAVGEHEIALEERVGAAGLGVIGV